MLRPRGSRSPNAGLMDLLTSLASVPSVQKVGALLNIHAPHSFRGDSRFLRPRPEPAIGSAAEKKQRIDSFTARSGVLRLLRGEAGPGGHGAREEVTGSALKELAGE